MQTFNKIIRDGKALLSKYQLEENIAELLMADLMNVSLTTLIIKGNECVSKDIYNTYKESLVRIINDEPMQYVTGFQHFYGRTFKVTPATLIPRNETEELVALILSRVKSGTVVDVGTGTGAIGITLKLENEDFDVYATDISKDALNVAKTNSDILNADVTFLEGDLFAPLIEMNKKIDVLVSNPPYIREDEIKHMSPSVLKYEPKLALFAKEDGLYFYRQMIENLDQIFESKGQAFFEIGWQQKEAVIELVNTNWPNAYSEVIKDINGQNRILYIDWVK